MPIILFVVVPSANTKLPSLGWTLMPCYLHAASEINVIPAPVSAIASPLYFWAPFNTPTKINGWLSNGVISGIPPGT